jgi:hypothetical protein
MSLDRILFSELKLLSKQISTKEPFFREIACLGKEEAELIAYCHIIKLFFPNNQKLNEILDKKIIPSFKMLGMVTWNRDVLTEMGLKLGYAKEKGTLPKELEERLDATATETSDRQ